MYPTSVFTAFHSWIIFGGISVMPFSLIALSVLYFLNCLDACVRVTNMDGTDSSIRNSVTATSAEKMVSKPIIT